MISPCAFINRDAGVCVERHKFLFVSKDGLSGDIAWRVQEEGHAVRYAITDNEFSTDVAEGFVPRYTEWRPHVDWADVIVFDDTFGLGEHAERLREDGHAVVGGTATTDRLEEDRGFANTVLEEAGIETLPNKVFTDFNAAIEHIEENPGPYVIKPNGDVQNFKQLLYVGEDDDGQDVIHRLRRYRDKWGDEIASFQLQQRVEGVEVAIAGFFNGDRFVGPINLNFEHKRFCSGDLGPMTPEMGTHMLWTGRNRLFQETIGRFEAFLREEGYRGVFDLNCIVNESGIHPLEFSPRFGYPTIFIMEEGIQSSMAEVLHAIAHRDDPEIEVHDGFQTGVRIVVPPYPYDDDDCFNELSQDLPIRFDLEDPREQGIHIEDVKQDEDGLWRVAGATGEALVVTGKGSTVQEAQDEMYRRAEKVRIPCKYYRTDIGDRWHREVSRLQEWGYIDLPQ